MLITMIFNFLFMMIQSGLWKKELLLLLHDYLVSVVVRARLILLKTNSVLRIIYMYSLSTLDWIFSSDDIGTGTL